VRESPGGPVQLEADYNVGTNQGAPAAPVAGGIPVRRKTRRQTAQPAQAQQVTLLCKFRRALIGPGRDHLRAAGQLV